MLQLIVGLAATILGMSISIPQVLKVYKTKSVDDLSALTIFLYISSTVLWATYAVIIDDVLVLIANVFAVCVNLILGYLWLRYRSR